MGSSGTVSGDVRRRLCVVLMGYRGAGKSTVGRRLAKELGREFVDTDDLIVSMAGKAIGEIFAERGEAGFRDVEERAVAMALGAEVGRGRVVALGGGAVLRPANQELIRGQFGVYLACSAEELSRRLSRDAAGATGGTAGTGGPGGTGARGGTGHARPSLTGAASAADLGEITTLLAVREPIYRSLARITLDVSVRCVDDVVDDIVSRLPAEFIS